MDNINPNHYRASKVQPIELIRDMPFSLGNAIKYISRCRFKGNKTQDLKKALWYVQDYNKNGSKINIQKNTDNMLLSEEFKESLLGGNDDFEKETILKIYDNYVKNQDFSEVEKNIQQEIEKVNR